MRVARTVLLTVILVAATAGTGVTAAQNDGGGLAACGERSDHATDNAWRECLVENADKDTILSLVDVSPDRIQDREINAVSAVVEAEKFNFSSEQEKSVNEWLDRAQGDAEQNSTGDDSEPPKQCDEIKSDSEGIVCLQEENDGENPVLLELNNGSTRIVHAEWEPKTETVVLGFETDLTGTLTVADHRVVGERGGGVIPQLQYTLQRGEVTYVRIPAPVEDREQTIQFTFKGKSYWYSDDKLKQKGFVPISGPFNSTESKLILGVGVLGGLGTLALLIRRRHKKRLSQGVIRR